MQFTGGDAMRLLSTRDPVEALAMHAVAERWSEIAAERDEALATRIANAVGRMLSGKGGGG